MLEHAVERLLVLYPRVLAACRTKRVRVGSEESVSDHQAEVLALLDGPEPLSLKELAALSGVTPSTMSLTTDRLVRRGFIVREQDKRDRRRIKLRLSKAGQEVARNRSILDPDRVEELLGSLSPNKRRQVIRGLSILAKAAEDLER